MIFNPGDYVSFAIQRHNGKPPEKHIGRVEKNPAEGLFNAAFVPIPGKISVIYMTGPHGANERVMLAEADLTLVSPNPSE